MQSTFPTFNVQQPTVSASSSSYINQERKCEKIAWKYRKGTLSSKKYLCQITFSFPALRASLSMRYVATAICRFVTSLLLKSLVYAALICPIRSAKKTIGC